MKTAYTIEPHIMVAKIGTRRTQTNLAEKKDMHITYDLR